MNEFTHASLFSGIGGFDLAAEWMGWRNVFHCEINQFGQKILKHYWPKAISYEDIKTTDFTIHRGTIDILTGGFPCQPYSLAGKRLGKEDDRHLWPEMLRAIREIQPRWVVGENVYGIVNWNGGMVFNEAQTDLEAAGYEIQPVILPACGVNAPHRRDRIWFIAYNSNARTEGVQFGGKNGIYESEIIADTSKFAQRRERQKTNCCEWENDKPVEERREVRNRIKSISQKQFTSNPDQLDGDLSGFRTSEIPQQQKARIFENNVTNAYGKRHEQFNATTESVKPKFNTRFSFNKWVQWPTQSPICSGNDGIPTKLDGITFSKHRNESIKAYGNAIVPQVAYEIFKAINLCEINTYPENVLKEIIK